MSKLSEELVWDLLPSILSGVWLSWSWLWWWWWWSWSCWLSLMSLCQQLTPGLQGNSGRFLVLTEGAAKPRFSTEGEGSLPWPRLKVRAARIRTMALISKPGGFNTKVTLWPHVLLFYCTFLQRILCIKMWRCGVGFMTTVLTLDEDDDPVKKPHCEEIQEIVLCTSYL